MGRYLFWSKSYRGDMMINHWMGYRTLFSNKPTWWFNNVSSTRKLCGDLTHLTQQEGGLNMIKHSQTENKYVMIHTVSSSCVLFISNWFSGRLGIDTVDTFTSRVAIFLEFRGFRGATAKARSTVDTCG